jgi:hypothetical protein
MFGGMALDVPKVMPLIIVVSMTPVPNVVEQHGEELGLEGFS